MDSIDTKLIDRLQQDGREPWATLGGALGLTGPAVAERVKRLQQRGVIRSFAALCDPAGLGLPITAFVAVTLDRPSHRARFLKLAQGLPEIQECHHTAGDGDYLLKVRCRGMGDLERLVSEKLKGLPGVTRTKTTVVLSTPKETPRLPVPAP